MQTRQRAYIWCQVLGWSAHALVSLGFAWLPSGPLSLRYALAILWAEALAGYSSHLFRNWILRHAWLDLPPRRIVPRVFAGSLCCGTAVTLLTTASSLLLGFQHDPNWNWINLVPAFMIWSVVIFLWAAIYLAFGYFERYRDARFEQLRLAVAAKDLELRALLSQVNPHFLFNCLTSLRALTVEDPARAQEMIDQLSSLLRYSLQSGRFPTVPLERELDAIRAYLRLESIRFEERLSVHIDVEPRALAIPVPPMLVQMLVENGVKHGISHLSEGGEISITTAVELSTLRIQVTNTGQLRPEASNATAVGLHNTRERLRLLYGGKASVELRNAGHSTVLAEVLLPIHPPAAA